VSVAGSRPGQAPAKLAPSSTVSDPPCFGAPLALAEVVLVLVLDDPHAARPAAATAARQTDVTSTAGRLILRLANVLGLTSMLPPIEMLPLWTGGCAMPRGPGLGRRGRQTSVR
jgi:hypothetical protein